MNVNPRVRDWMVMSGAVAPGLDQHQPSFARLGWRLLRAAQPIPTTPWDGTALGQGLMNLQVKEMKLRRKDLSRRECEQTEAEAHELRNLSWRLGSAISLVTPLSLIQTDVPSDRLPLGGMLSCPVGDGHLGEKVEVLIRALDV